MTDYSGYRMNERGCTAERSITFFFWGGGGGVIFLLERQINHKYNRKVNFAKNFYGGMEFIKGHSIQLTYFFVFAYSK